MEAKTVAAAKIEAGKDIGKIPLVSSESLSEGEDRPRDECEQSLETGFTPTGTRLDPATLATDS
jgi:hypothetical protein